MASRNPFTSPLFDRLCKILLLQNYKAKDNVVIKDDDVRIRQFIGKNYTNFKVMNYEKSELVVFLITSIQIIKKLIKCLFYVLSAYVSTRMIPKRKDISKNTILIDSYIHTNYILKNDLKDKHLPHLQSLLHENDLESLFLPTLIFSPKIFKCYLKLRSKYNNLLIKESFLRFYDYALIICITFSKVRLSPKIYFKGIDVTELIKDELHDNRFDISFINAFINYFFYKNLKRLNLDFKSIVLWFENQVQNKGHCLGAKKYYKNKKVIGYTSSFICENYHMYQVPLDYEINSFLSPSHIVLSTLGNDYLFKRLYNKNIFYGPSFRFNHLKDVSKKIKSNSCSTICFLCEIDYHRTIKNLYRVIQVLEELNNAKTINLIIKYHPACIHKFNLKPHEKINYIHIKDSFNAALSGSNIVIGSGTLSITESLLYNCFVILLSNNSGVTQVPVPKNFQRFINLIYCDTELKNSIKNNLDYNYDNMIKFHDLFVNPDEITIKNLVSHLK